MPLVIIKPDDPPWEECKTLEEWVRMALKAGREEEVVSLLNTLPEASRKKYRDIWVLHKQSKKERQ